MFSRTVSLSSFTVPETFVPQGLGTRLQSHLSTSLNCASGDAYTVQLCARASPSPHGPSVHCPLTPSFLTLMVGNVICSPALTLVLGVMLGDGAGLG